MNWISPDETRVQFSRAMSHMYGEEVPAYTTLMDLVSDINQKTLSSHPLLKQQLDLSNNLQRITEERHGAIRLGKAEELYTMRRLFSVIGMHPVSYYDLSVAGIPVHATAFRPLTRERLSINPFRVFTSLLRLDLLDDTQLREDAEAVLATRDIFTPRVRELIEKFEQQGGLGTEDSVVFVEEALETFRWHSEATVTAELYQRLHDAHRLVADVVSFKGPHINHLTPRTLDIDLVQEDMPRRGITPKLVVEGPPPRHCPILLRQTSFKALEEPVRFLDEIGDYVDGKHTARFGEIEQRGVALTPKGRKLYDELLYEARELTQKDENLSYEQALSQVFSAFPDDWEALRIQKLAYFEYHANGDLGDNTDFQDLISEGKVTVTPVIYEDFLPVSAAGIFQSNLGGESGQNFPANTNQAAFEEALGASVIDEFSLYETIQQQSIEDLLDN